MFIEVHISGQLLHRWEIDEENFTTIPGATWEENVKAREMIIRRYVEHMIRFTDPLLAKLQNAKYYLLFPSKGNLIPREQDEPLIQKKSNSDYEQSDFQVSPHNQGHYY